MPQEKRERNLNAFKSGKIPIMLCTDIAARGIHCENIEYVINYDFPASLEQYVHRCGRCGRWGQTKSNTVEGKKVMNGIVYSFFHRELAPMAKDLLQLLRLSNAWVDPNLLVLIPGETSKSSNESRNKRRKKNKVLKLKTDINSSAHISYASTDDEFSYLDKSRIALKRASDVSISSDASDDH